MSDTRLRAQSVASALEHFAASVAQSGVQPALIALNQRLDQAPVTAWIACAQEVVRLCDGLNARGWLLQALTRWPAAIQLRYWLAQVLWQDNEVQACERVLGDLLAVEPDHAEAVYLLAKVWRSQGKLKTAATWLHDWCMRSAARVETTLKCAQFIEQCQQQRLALELCDREIARGTTDVRVLASSANLALQLGQFELARSRALAALDSGVPLNEWFVMQTLALTQHYRDANHPDFALFKRHLSDPALTPKARAAILFALAKAFDNVGDYAHAAQSLREAHELACELTPWSPTSWSDLVVAQLAGWRPSCPLSPVNDAIPVFIVGLPRSGTTLVAELLGRHPQVRNRGELSFLPFVARELAASGRADEPTALHEAAEVYLAQLRQDDEPTRYYIDKNPLNFRYLGLAATLFPNARIVHCERNRRDTALSIWSQFFAHGEYGFAHTFANIAAFATGHDRLMRHWRETLPMPIYTLDYETLVQQPEPALKELRVFLGIADPVETAPERATAAITSSSMWQARQPVYQSSLQRWRAYAAFIPELVECFPATGESVA